MKSLFLRFKQKFFFSFYNVGVIIVILKENFSESEKVKSRPKILLDVDKSFIHLHQHVIA